MTTEELIEKQNATDAGKFLTSIGQQYYNTESNARHVAEEAAFRIRRLEVALKEIQDICLADTESEYIADIASKILKGSLYVQ